MNDWVDLCTPSQRNLPTEHKVGTGYCIKPQVRESLQRESASTASCTCAKESRKSPDELVADLAKQAHQLLERRQLRDRLDEAQLSEATRREILDDVRASMSEGHAIDWEQLEDIIEARQQEEAAVRPHEWDVQEAKTEIETAAKSLARIIGFRGTENFLRQMSIKAGAGALGGDA